MSALLTAEERQAMRERFSAAKTAQTVSPHDYSSDLLRALDSDEARERRITDLWTVNEALREVLATVERERDEARAELALDRVIKEQALAELDESQRWIRDAHARTDEARTESARRLALLARLEWTARSAVRACCCPVCGTDQRTGTHDARCALAAELALA